MCRLRPGTFFPLSGPPDNGKKINGRKRHVIVDCLGMLLMVLVTPASTTDRDAAHGLLERLRARHRNITLVWADGGYTGRLVDWARERLRIALTVVKRSDDARGFIVLPRRWVVERTLSWQYLTDWRMALARDHLRTGELAMTHIARSLGYSSPYAFAAAFRRHHGEPPGTWRQRESLRAQTRPGNDPHAR
jgi:AraC-like DNA-binding protein